MRFLLVTLGSIGDLMPFLAVGEGLRARGHAVTIATNAGYAQLVAMAGFDFAAIWRQPQQPLDDVIANDPARAWAMVRAQMFEPAVRPTFDVIAQAARREPCVVVAAWAAFGARLAHEKLKVPLATVYLSPHALTEDDGCGVHPLGFFPDWFCAPRPNWPRDLVLTGFPLFADAQVPALPPELEAFLQAGPPPVIFSTGSFLRQAGGFFQESLAACARLGQRAILLTPYADQVPALPATARHFKYVALQRLAPRAAALVHHGGIGTAAQALRAGIPQLVSPLFFDQFDNAACLATLGVGDSIARDQYRADLVAQKLDALLKTGPDARICLRGHLAAENAVAGICDAVERLIPH